MAALPAGADRPGSHAVSEFHHRDEAVAAGAVEPPGSFVPAGPEGGQGAPARRGERNRDTGARIAERLDDVAGEPLETIDLAPRNLPASVVPGELGGSGRQRAQQLGRGGTGRDVFVSRHACPSGRAADGTAHLIAPGDRQGGGDRALGPAEIPFTQGPDL